MSTFLEGALRSAARGFRVHPLKPETKEPLTHHGWKDASGDEAQVREWWAKWPNANVGIACGPSGVCVVDCDHGLKNAEEFEAWRDKAGLPATYTVRTGRRDSFGVQMYFSGLMPTTTWDVAGCSGDVKSVGGYVLAAGSIHPDSKETYQVLCDAPLAPLPEMVRTWKRAKQDTSKAGQPITEHRNVTLISIAGRWRNDGMTEDGLTVALLQYNADYCIPPLEDEEVRRIAHNAAQYPIPESVGEVVIGEQAASPARVDWRTLFHTKDAMVNAPPITFLIQDYLMCEGVTAIAAPVRERKSLIALNIVHALLTGEKLFDHFEVVQKPSRVLYLCPEVSLGPFTDRVRKIGLLDFVGETLFCRTLSADGHLALDAPELEPALPGSVVVLDTAIRFLRGDENSSADVRAFADSIFALLRAGAESVVMLHHSPKESGDVMTLENAMRGSGDMGAFLACCWGTRLQDPTKPYESASFLSNLKQRDFESADFEVTCSPDCRMHIIGDPSTRSVTAAPRKNRTNKDGLEDAAIQFLKDHPEMSLRDTAQGLKGAGIRRGKDWVRDRRYEMLQENGGQMPCLSAGGKR
jgi:hypothetical protein